ncbi:MAG: hypothetical protein V7K69_07690 [Nostoc sp.]
MNQFNLVIFDCDGVLIDSERIANTILLEMLKEIGLFLTLEDVFDIFVGTSTTRCLEIVKNLLGKSPPENFATEFEERIMQAFMSGAGRTPRPSFLPGGTTNAALLNFTRGISKELAQYNILAWQN